MPHPKLRNRSDGQSVSKPPDDSGVSVYRIYTLEDDDRIKRPPREVICEDDEVALTTAKALLNSRVIEIWQGKRVVARLDPEYN